MKPMLTDAAKQELTKQQYRLVGEHSAVKTCGWTKNMIKGIGGCYKLKFYGVMSNQCLQMTTSISCANRCTFCWRGYKAPVSKDWQWAIDEPEKIIEGALLEHKQLLFGFKGNPKINRAAYLNSETVKHVALSLTGEPIMYPRLNELLDKFHARGISTFLVTNAQYPEKIRSMKPITQLYISVDAPTKDLLKNVDKPLFKDYWERLLESLDVLAQKKQRTCIRLTIVKGINDVDLEKYAELIHRGNPDFLEIKSYMFVGASMERLQRENMPDHEYIVEFSKKLVAFLPEYEICSEHVPSRVVMLAKKKFKHADGWYTWIDFPKFEELVRSGKECATDDYLKKTPATGLSGTGTKEWLAKIQEEKRKKKEAAKVLLYVDEKTDELEFWREKNKKDIISS